jgi:ribosome-binding factor A
MSSRRQQQVGDFVRDEISQILMYDMKDPRLGLVSIMRVEMSPDLRYARVFVSVYGDEDERQNTLRALSGAAGYIRRLLAPRIHARHIPELSFRLDRSMEHAESISRALNQILQDEPSPSESDAGDSREPDE